MWHIKVLLMVGDVEVDLVTYFDAFYVVRCKVTPDGRHVNVHLISGSFHPGFSRALYSVG